MTTNQLRALRVGDKIKITRASLARFFGNSGVVTACASSERLVTKTLTATKEMFVSVLADEGYEMILFADEIEKLT